jgi:single-stranded-DNA-specific exonuclease
LPKYAVIAANSGYLPGLVAFSMRTSRGDLNLPQLLQGLDLEADGASFGYGHDQASGGQLPPAVFNRLLSILGFAEDAFVEIGVPPQLD